MEYLFIISRQKDLWIYFYEYVSNFAYCFNLVIFSFECVLLLISLGKQYSNCLHSFLRVTLDWKFLRVHTVRSSHWRCSLGKGVLRNFPKLAGKHLYQVLFSANLLKERLLQVLSYEFCEISKNTFFCRTPPERFDICKKKFS